MRREQRDLWLEEYTKLYEEDRLIRGTYRQENSVGEQLYCAVGCALYLVGRNLGTLTQEHLDKIVAANDSGWLGDGACGSPVTPSGFAEVCRLIKEIPCEEDK